MTAVSRYAVSVSVAIVAAGCVGTHAVEDASSNDAGMDGGAPVVDVAPTPDVFSPPDATRDAARSHEGLVCTGSPIPDGLVCVVQDASIIGPCDGRGGVAFDGVRCRIARGPACGSAGRGVFDSLEECGVTCAAAGYCDLSVLFVDTFAPGVMPLYCGDAPRECFVMFSRGSDLLPEDCAVWAPFGPSPPTPYQALSSEIPFPEHWPLLYSLSLAADVLGEVYCDQRDPSP